MLFCQDLLCSSIYNLFPFFYLEELTFDKVTDSLSMFVERHSNAVQIDLMAVYKKELIFYKVTDALFIFVKIYDFLRHCNAVQIGLMAVIRKSSLLTE